jgi:hypothetical protein
VVERIDGLGAEVVRIRSGRDVWAAVRDYLRHGSVSWVEPVYTAQVYRTPNDPSFNSQWALHNTSQTGGTTDADIDAPEAWDVVTAASVPIAIVDTGVQTGHPDLSANIVQTITQGSCPSFVDDCNHGTLIAGIAGAVGNNGVGVSGVVWDADLINVPFDFTSTGAAEAIRLVADHSQSMGSKLVMTASWGSSGSCPSVVSEALDYARARGVLVVTAAGNDSRNIDSNPDWPSNCPQDNVISVTSTNDRDQLASFSNIGVSNVDLAAPGVDILTTRSGSGYESPTGTSISVPFVAGAAALVWARNPSFTYGQVRSRIFSTVDSLSSLSGRVATGGRLNLARAVGASTTSPTPPAPDGTGTVTGTTFGSGGGGFLCLIFGGCGSSARSGVTVRAGSQSGVSGSNGAYTVPSVPAGSATVTASTTTTSQSFFGPPSTSVVNCTADSSGGPTSKSVTVPDGGTVQVNWHCPSGGGGGFASLFGSFFGGLFG